MAKAVSKLVAGTRYKVETPVGGFTIVADQPQAVGGNSSGPNPKEFLLAAIGSCTVQTLMMAAAKRKWDIQELSVEVSINEIDDPDPSKPAGSKVVQIDERIEVKGNVSAAELTAMENTAVRCPVLKLVVEPKLVTKTAIKV